MSGPQPYSTRWQIMEILAATRIPLTIDDIASRVGKSCSTARDVLRRPIRARWVVISHEHGSGFRGNAVKNLYAITDLGRRALADHLREKESS